MTRRKAVTGIICGIVFSSLFVVISIEEKTWSKGYFDVAVAIIMICLSFFVGFLVGATKYNPFPRRNTE